MKRPRNRNVIVLLLVLGLAAATAAAGLVLRADQRGDGRMRPGADAGPYLLVTAAGTTYQPILLSQESTFTLTQGEAMVNVIHATPEAVWMESSTCENQNCVQQGAVTLDNRHSRLLGNMIICLPHQVQLELYAADELRAMGIALPEDGE